MNIQYCNCLHSYEVTITLVTVYTVTKSHIVSITPHNHQSYSSTGRTVNQQGESGAVPVTSYLAMVPDAPILDVRSVVSVTVTVVSRYYRAFS
jgi:hypothetical protein